MSNQPTATEITHFLNEDIGDGDITVHIISSKTQAKASVKTREAMVLCGQAWFDAIFQTLDSKIAIHWLIPEGNWVE